MIGSDISIFVFIAIGVTFIVLAVLSIERLLLLTLFFAPLSVQVSYLAGEAPFDLSLPTEPVLALLLFITLFKLIVTREFSVKILRNPVTVIIALYLLWTLVTAITSSMAVVSFKVVVYRVWFIAGFYLIAAHLFMKEGFSRKYVIAYSLGLAVVVIYFLVKTGGAGLLNQKFAHSACYPFFRDHTSFGAAMAFVIPPVIVMAFRKEARLLVRSMLIVLLLLFIAGFIFSYSRAAWVSLIVALAAASVLWLRMPEKMLYLSAAAFLIVLTLSADRIWQRMDSTTEDSSADLAQHLRSSSNISTDQSNLERINRWKCALRMFAQKPVMGWGPGTYQFQYAPFQRHKERTIISTDFGDAGNAHSEYLGALSETGLPGALLFIALTFMAILTGVKVWYRENRSWNGYFTLAILTGLMTYMIHGLMNSFLDSDKIASLWWGFIAMLVALDIKGKDENAHNSGN